MRIQKLAKEECECIIALFLKEIPCEAIKNPFVMGSNGAESSVTCMLTEKNVALFVAGKIGRNIKPALSQKGIKF